MRIRRRVLAALRRRSRDNARTPMQWDGAPGAGFSDGPPWIPVNPNHTWLNAASQTADPGSIYSFYRALIAMRHDRPAIVDGDFAVMETGREQIYAFRRSLGDETIEVYVNLSDQSVTMDGEETEDAQLLLGELRRLQARLLAPRALEVRVYRR